MKKVNLLILGGFGFIGTNIIKFIDTHFIDKYNVIVFDKLSNHPHGITFKCVSKIYSGDFSDELNIEKIFVENKINIVLHLLSSTVPATSINAKFDVLSNLIPTLNLLSIMDKNKVKNIIYFSSGGAIYGDHQKLHSELDPVFPKSSYAIVKHAIERYLLLYAEIYNFNSLIIRLSNPFGPYHYNDKQGICNIAIRKALDNDIIQIWGDGNGRKDYIYIDDVCDILLKLIEKKIFTDVINIGSGSLLSINEIIEDIKVYIQNIKTEHINKSINDIIDFSLDISKLKNYIGHYQFTDFNMAISKTIKWAKDISLNHKKLNETI